MKMRLENLSTYTREMKLALAFALLIAATVFQLHAQGRGFWCACGQPYLWEGDIWCSHTSQHLFDPYSFTHILHGVLFCGILAWAFPRVPLPWRIFTAAAIECVWEIVENSQYIIQRYRSVTIGLGYEGDSIANSLSDISCCLLGFYLAYRLGLKRSIVFFVVVEVVLLFWIRDNLTLNILMLTWPIDAVKQWQMIR
jgi:hypothetical protein